MPFALVLAEDVHRESLELGTVPDRLERRKVLSALLNGLGRRCHLFEGRTWDKVPDDANRVAVLEQSRERAAGVKEVEDGAASTQICERKF